MNKNDRLNQLFADWKSNVQGEFYPDGIIDEELYSKDKKVLFIAKEPNNIKGGFWDYRKWFLKEMKYAFAYRLAEWNYGIQRGFPEYDSIWSNGHNEVHQSLKQIAFMNVKKTAGRAQSKFDDIEEHVANHKDRILAQIDIIDPNIIVLGLSWKRIRDSLFSDTKWTPSGYGVDIAKHSNGATMIDFYHPSSRNAPPASYSLLQNVFRKIEKT